MTSAPTHDWLLQGMVAEGNFRILAADTTALVETAREVHDLSPVAAEVLGRALTGAALLPRMLDKDVRNQYTTLRFDGDGPAGLVIAEGTVDGRVRGFIEHPHVAQSSESSPIGSTGRLTVVRGVPPNGAPYTSQLELTSGEVAKEIAHFLSASEQVHSAVILGVFNRPEGVTAAGGIIIQAFPHTPEEELSRMEDVLSRAPSLSRLLQSHSMEQAIATILDGFDFKRLDSTFDTPLQYACTCSRDRARLQFAAFSPQEIGSMIQEDGGAEAVCQFCGRKYRFSADDLLALGGGSMES